MENSAKLFAIFGNPVLHSLSPQLFNAAFAAMRIDAHYARIQTDHASDIAHAMRSLPLAGASITTPFKTAVMPHLSTIAPDALAIGGVNTIVNSHGGLHGFNTDHVGVTQALIEAGCDLKRCRCLVLGAGPAARAAVYGLLLGGADVTVANRTHSKALRIAEDFGCSAVAIDDVQHALAQFHIVLSAVLPDANPVEGAVFMPNQVFLDANYRISALGQYVEKYGCRMVSGRRWLLHQAVAAFKHFVGLEVAPSSMEQGLNIAKRSCEPLIAPLHIENFRTADLLIPHHAAGATK